MTYRLWDDTDSPTFKIVMAACFAWCCLIALACTIWYLSTL